MPLRGLFPLESQYLLEGLDLARPEIYVNWKPVSLFPTI